MCWWEGIVDYKYHFHTVFGYNLTCRICFCKPYFSSYNFSILIPAVPKLGLVTPCGVAWYENVVVGEFQKAWWRNLYRSLFHLINKIFKFYILFFILLFIFYIFIFYNLVFVPQNHCNVVDLKKIEMKNVSKIIFKRSNSNNERERP